MWGTIAFIFWMFTVSIRFALLLHGFFWICYGCTSEKTTINHIGEVNPPRRAHSVQDDLLIWKKNNNNKGSSQLWSLPAPVLSKLISRHILCTSSSIFAFLVVSFFASVSFIMFLAPANTRFPIPFLFPVGSAPTRDRMLIYHPTFLFVNAIYGLVSFSKYISFHHFKVGKIHLWASSFILPSSILLWLIVRPCDTQVFSPSPPFLWHKCSYHTTDVFSSRTPFRFQSRVAFEHSFQCLFSLVMWPYMQYYSIIAGT